MTSQFQVYRDQRNNFRWRLMAENHRTIAVSSEGYVARPDCINGIEVTRRGQARGEFFQDNAGEWRWRTVHANGRTIATSGEGYKTRADCEHGWGLVNGLAAAAPVVDVPGATVTTPKTGK